MRRLIFAAIALAVAAGYYLLQVSRPIASWHMINVNYAELQGDANLLTVGDTNIMIDAGYAEEAKIAVLPYLEQLELKRIDHFFVSHPHRDHYEGLAVILDAGIEIKNLYYHMPEEEIEDCCYDKVHFQKFLDFAKDHGSKLIDVEAGLKFSLPNDAGLEILHAQRGNLPNVKLDVNDLSLIMRFTVAGSSVLFTGDLNFHLGSKLSGNPAMQSTFLKMPHHGITGIAPNSFFDTVNPRFVLVPGTKALWCSERGAQARDWTAENKVPTWVNGINGHIRVDWKPGQSTISPEQIDGSCKLKAFGEIEFR